MALSHRKLWSLIHLPWPPNIVKNYLERAQQFARYDLTIRLDTGKTSTDDFEENQARWTALLMTEWSHVASLELHLHRHTSQALAPIIDTRAPRLREATIFIAADTRCIRSLFNGDAPLLRSLTVNSPFQREKLQFPDLRILSLKVGPSNASKLLETLREKPLLEDLTLIGMPGLPVLPRKRSGIVYLNACSSLAIRRMKSDRVVDIIANVSFASLKTIVIFEETVTSHDDPNAFLMSIFATLPLLNHKAVTPNLSLETSPKLRDSLFLFLQSEQFALEIRGYRFHASWKGLVREHTKSSILPTIIQAILLPTICLQLQPSRLYIANGIVAPQRFKNIPLFLTQADLHRLLRSTFAAYPSVQFLDITGEFEEVQRVLGDTEAGYLPNLSVVNTAVPLRWSAFGHGGETPVVDN